MQAVQKAGEAIYLPYGTPHTVHNLEDNVAFTENYLFVDAVPGKIKASQYKLLTPGSSQATRRLLKFAIFCRIIESLSDFEGHSLLET